MGAQNPLSFEFDIPTMLRSGDLNAGRAKINELVAALRPMQEAIERARSQITLVGVADRLEKAEEDGLKSVWVSVEMESNDEGGSYASMSVACDYASSLADDVDNIEDQLQELLCDVATDLYDLDFPCAEMAPENFLRQLSVSLLGEEEGPAWLAAREAAAISEVVPKTKKVRGSMSI